MKYRYTQIIYVYIYKLEEASLRKFSNRNVKNKLKSKSKGNKQWSFEGTMVTFGTWGNHWDRRWGSQWGQTP